MHYLRTLTYLWSLLTLLLMVAITTICSCVSTPQRSGQLKEQDEYDVQLIFGRRVTMIRWDATHCGVNVQANGKLSKKVIPVSKDTISQRFLCGDTKWTMTRR